MKKFLGAFALAGLVSIAACDSGDETVIDDPVLEETTPPIVNEPVTTPPPMTPPAAPMDSMADTTVVEPATGAAPATPGTTP